jgi:predicted RNase H-like nuclease
MSMRGPHRGAPLPYRTLAGVVPTPRGWLAVTGKLQGITLSAEEPQIFRTFLDILDYKPAYQVIAAFVPIGLLEEPVSRGRSCERDARRLLGWPRAGAIASSPVRKVLTCDTYEEAVEVNGGFLSPVTWRQRRRIAEVDRDIGPYWQRTVFEVHPELSFFQLNDDKPMNFSKHSAAGKEERHQTLVTRFPGIERVLDTALPGISLVRLLDATACLWTARRIMSRAVSRVPEDPEWDSTGLRMELVR